MDVQPLIDLANNSVYPAQGLLALYGVFCLVLVFRKLQRKQFRGAAADAFLAEVRSQVERGKFDEAAGLCDAPPWWSKAVPQLMLVAINNRKRDGASLRRLLAETFERDVLAEIEYRMAWVNTVVKSAPMLGLLGTVLGMISAFGKIAATQKGGNDPSLLAQDISFALITTAVGLIIAIPLVVAQSAVHVRTGKLQDGVQKGLGEFLESMEIGRALESDKRRSG